MLCDDCRAAVVWLEEPICMRCGRPTNHIVIACHVCQEQAFPLQQARAAALFMEPVSRVIHLMKYEGYFALAQPLADLMVAAWPRWQMIVDLVIPIPLSRQRYRQRGYNQAERLAHYFCRQMGFPLATTLLQRAKATRPQVGLEAAERRGNVRGAFVAATEGIAGQHILLIDDVCTTGATLAAAAETLLAAGAASVSGYCVARAADHTVA